MNVICNQTVSSSTSACLNFTMRKCSTLFAAISKHDQGEIIMWYQHLSVLGCHVTITRSNCVISFRSTSALFISAELNIFNADLFQKMLCNSEKDVSRSGALSEIELPAVSSRILQWNDHS